MFDCRSIICCLMFNDSDVNHSISACSVDWRSKLQAGSLHSRLFTKIVHTFGVFLRLMVESYLHYDYPPVIKHGNGESTIYGWFCHWNLIYRWFFALVKPSFLDDVPIFFVHSIFSNDFPSCNLNPSEVQVAEGQGRKALLHIEVARFTGE